jgi:NAD(P)-dependent dehydrogenase (short-subunit alcohol dehydrogenase family)
MTDEITGVAVVTGAGSGIGRATAAALAESGWRVALAGRREEPLRETARLLGEDRALAIPADVTDPDSVAALFDTVADHWSRVDLLFNNAGVGAFSAPVDEIPFAQWRRTVDTNLNGSFLCAQAAFRLMRRQRPQGGRIINNGSVSAHVPRPQSAAYTATKHAVTGLTKSLALDGRAHRIAVGQIDIGNAATEMTGRMATGILQADGRTAAEPVMDAADVARTVVHMASLPLEANIPFVTVMATGMPYLGRG